MLFLKFRRITAGLLAAVMLVSASAVAVAEDKPMPTEFSGAYQFQEVGTLQDVLNRVAEPVLKEIDDYSKSDDKDSGALRKLFESLFNNAKAHNEAHSNRERTDLFYFNEDWFKGDADVGMPNLDTVIMSQQLSIAVCTNNEVGVDDPNAFLEELGFNNIRVYNSEYDSVDTDARGTRFVIAAKPLADDTTLVTVLPDINNTTPSWTDNLDIGSMETDGIYHGGFSKAARFAKECLDEYVHGISGDVKYWITGYSRGGAISNLLSAFLTDDAESGVEQKDVFTYTFSCPNTVELSESDTAHKNIHNYISKYDIVPAVPPHTVSDGMNLDGTVSEDGLTFRRYGIDHIIQDISGVEEADTLEYLYAMSPTIYDDYRTYGMASDFEEMELAIPDTINLELHGAIGILTDSIVERMYGANPEDMDGIVSIIDTIAGLFSSETAGLLKDFVEQMQELAKPDQLDEQKVKDLNTTIYRVLASLTQNDSGGLIRPVEKSITQEQYIAGIDKNLQNAVTQITGSYLEARDGMDEDSKLNLNKFRATLLQTITKINEQEGITLPDVDYSEILNIDNAKTYRDLYDMIYRVIETFAKSASDEAEEKTEKQKAIANMALGILSSLRDTIHDVISQLTACKTDTNGKSVFTNRVKQTQKDLTASILLIYFASRLQNEENVNNELVEYLTNVAVGKESDVKYADDDVEDYQFMGISGCLSRVIYSFLRAAHAEYPYTDESGKTVYGEVDEKASVDIAGNVVASALRLIKNNKLVIGEIFNPETKAGSSHARQLKAFVNGMSTLSHNIKRLLYAHYPEVYLSWLKASAANDPHSFYYGGVVAPMGVVEAGGTTKFALLGEAKYDAAFARAGENGKTVNVERTSYDEAKTVAPGTIDISDLDAEVSSGDTSTILNKDINAGNILQMEGNISVTNNTSQMDNGLTGSEVTMRAEGAFKMLFSNILQGYAQLKERIITGTVTKDNSSTDWDAYYIDVSSAKKDEEASERTLIRNASAVNTRIDAEKNTKVTTRKKFVRGEEIKDKNVTEWDVTKSDGVSSYRAEYDNEGNVSNLFATLSLTIPVDTKTLTASMKNKTLYLMGDGELERIDYDIESVIIEDDVIKTVNLKGMPEPSVIYVAVYDGDRSLKTVRKIDVTKETSYNVDLPLIEDGSYKVLLWGTDMRPIGIKE